MVGLDLPDFSKLWIAFILARTYPPGAAGRTGKDSIETNLSALLAAAGLLALSLSLSQPRAGELIAPAETPAQLPRGAGAAARLAITLIGAQSTNALGKPCLAYDNYSRPRAANLDIFDYLVGIRNNCPRSIKVRICHKGSSDCSRVAVHSYQRRETVMGFGPKAVHFTYTVKEDP
ncbi:MAG: hypothetical protein L0Y50_05115 [Beijerinckiaceae bacterium]|nr:hypothetical protein [Beijerinckiaceae bacterium]MCI0735638.1 hypothetical protein [Beijerinckiaceae bacterium]